MSVALEHIPSLLCLRKSDLLNQTSIQTYQTCAQIEVLKHASDKGITHLLEPSQYLTQPAITQALDACSSSIMHKDMTLGAVLPDLVAAGTQKANEPQQIWQGLAVKKIEPSLMTSDRALAICLERWALMKGAG